VGNYILSIGSEVIVLCVLSCADLSVRECGLLWAAMELECVLLYNNNNSIFILLLLLLLLIIIIIIIIIIIMSEEKRKCTKYSS